jgi:hypothetical protein
MGRRAEERETGVLAVKERERAAGCGCSECKVPP